MWTYRKPQEFKRPETYTVWVSLNGMRYPVQRTLGK
jgi:hypothetical protein